MAARLASRASSAGQVRRAWLAPRPRPARLAAEARPGARPAGPGAALGPRPAGAAGILPAGPGLGLALAGAAGGLGRATPGRWSVAASWLGGVAKPKLSRSMAVCVGL